MDENNITLVNNVMVYLCGESLVCHGRIGLGL